MPLLAFKTAEVCVAAAVYVAARTWADARDSGQGVWSLIDWAMLAGILGTWHVLLLSRRLYASRRLGGLLHREAVEILIAVALLSSFSAVAGVFLSPVHATPAFLMAFGGGLAVLIIAGRVLLRRLLERLRLSGRNLRYVLVVGTGARARLLAQIIEERPELGVRILGCVDDAAFKAREAAQLPFPYLGPLEQLPAILSATAVDAVFVALPMRSAYQRIQEAVLHCEEQGVPVTLLTDFFSARRSRTRVEQIEDLPLMHLCTSQGEDWQVLAKRGIDLVWDGPLLT